MLAIIWHWWIAVVLMISLVIPATVMVVALYLRKDAPKPRELGRDER